MTFIDSVKKTGETIELYKYNGEDLKLSAKNRDDNPSDLKSICFLDTETTGVDKSEDKIIELAVKLIQINSKSGEVVQILNLYESFQDPMQTIEEEISLINGITNEMVKGKSIDWKIVDGIFTQANLIVAHNASFDRAFVDRSLPVSQDKLWGCSISDIDWLHRGFPNNKQELLCVWHGFYYDSHRAMNDVDALIHLVTHPHYAKDKPILELVENSRIPYYKIIARDCPFNLKDRVKANKYRWDGKYWWKRLDKAEIEDEKQWLIDNVYVDHFRGIVEEVPLINKYKDR